MTGKDNHDGNGYYSSGTVSGISSDAAGTAPIYTKSSEETAYDTGTYVADLKRILHADIFPDRHEQCQAVPLKVPEVMPDAEQL